MRRTFAVLCIVASSARAQTPIRQPVTKTVPKGPTSINLPSLTQLMVLSTPNFNTPSPFSLFPGQQATIHAQLSASFGTNLGVSLRYEGPLSGPSQVTIPPGQTGVDFVVTAGSTTSQATSQVKGWLVDSTQAKLALLSIVPLTVCNTPAPAIVTPQLLKRNTQVTINLTVPCALSAPMVVQVSSSSPTVVPPPPGNTITILPGTQSKSYTTVVGNVTSNLTVTISAFVPNTNPPVRALDVQLLVTP